MNSEIVKRGTIKLALILISGLLFSIGLDKEINVLWLSSNLYLIPLSIIGLIASIILMYKWKNRKQHFRLCFYLAAFSSLCFILYFNYDMCQLTSMLWRDGIYNGIMSFVLLLSATFPKVLDAILGFIVECLSNIF